jgi:hypothetical protein
MNAPTQSLNLSERLRIYISEGLKLLAIAVGCLVVFAIAFFIWVKTGLIRFHIPSRWVGLLYWTCALLWVILRQYKRDLRRGRFWVALLVFLALHVGVFAVVLRSYPQWPMVWFMFIFLIEGPLVMAALQGVVHTRHHR